MCITKFLFNYKSAVLNCPLSHNHIVHNKLKVLVICKSAILKPQYMLSPVSHLLTSTWPIYIKSPERQGIKNGKAMVKELDVTNSEIGTSPLVGQGIVTVPLLLTVISF